jgi:cell pole-organizing protein PopZ
MGDMSREPSMEEILSSIRRVISRDESTRNGGGPRLNALHSADDNLSTEPDNGHDDVLELTEMSGDNMARHSAPPKGDDHESHGSIDSAELISPVSAAASRQSLDALAAVLAGGRDQGATSTAGLSGDVTLNALVEAALRPLLKQWLDAHLPAMVERIVATEIARITGRR